jgi:hypothetical protein
MLRSCGAADVEVSNQLAPMPVPGAGATEAAGVEAADDEPGQYDGGATPLLVVAFVEGVVGCAANGFEDCDPWPYEAELPIDVAERWGLPNEVVGCDGLPNGLAGCEGAFENCWLTVCTPALNPSRSELAVELIAFCVRCVRDGCVPVTDCWEP